MNFSNIFDTHTHYHDSKFEKDMETVLTSLPDAGIFRIVNCGTTAASSMLCAEMADKYDYIYFAAGIHGLDAKNADISDIQKIENIISHKKCAAVGEIGLDYHYESETRDIQLFYFEEQLKLAVKYNKPVIVHDREAHKDTMDLLKKYHPKGVLHCFSGSTESAKEIINLGMYIGLGGAVTFKNAKKPVEVAASIPLNRLVLETDCPYMTPVPCRGQRNDSSYIPYTAHVIADIRNMDTQELINICTENAMDLFEMSE